MIPAEPIGSIARPLRLSSTMARVGHDARKLGPLYDKAVRDTIGRSDTTGSPLVTDDCGAASIGDDASTSRDTAFAQIGVHALRTAFASRRPGVG